MNKEENRLACITGASRGIGLELVQAFLAESGMHVAAITRNRETLINNLGKDFLSERLHIVECDLSTPAGRDVIQRTIGVLPQLRYLVHNAGTLLFKPFENISEAELKHVYDVNVFAPFMLTQSLLPLMKNCHSVFISSIGGVEGSLKFKGLSAYSTSKAAINCLTEMLAEEFKAGDNSFNCLALGSVETEMFKAAFPGFIASSSPEMMARYIKNFALESDKVMNGKIISLSRSNP